MTTLEETTMETTEMEETTKPRMTARERSDLQALVRQRARLMKAQAKQRALELQAEFEIQLQGHFAYDQDEVWKAAYAECAKVVNDAKAVIHQRCRELNIPDKFAPSLDLCWWRSGANATKTARADMRREAKMRIDALESAAKTEIERYSVETQTELIAEGLTTEAAQAFLEKLPSAESLMPVLELNQVSQGLLEMEHQKQRLLN